MTDKLIYTNWRMKSLETKVAAVKMRNITKTFGSVTANNKVWLDIYKGEILALLGENGSGKTTLMNMLSGIYFPDEGDIYINDEKVVIRSPKDAFDYGIGMIHQHFKLVDVLTAAENIILGLEGKLDIKAASAKIREICGLDGAVRLVITLGYASADDKLRTKKRKDITELVKIIEE